MNELTNFAIANGTYNNLETIIESNENTILLVNNLEILKQVNKKKWARGNLKYTIIVNNPTSANFNNIIVTDALDPSLVQFLAESVRINGIPAGYDIISYDNATGMLTVKLANIDSNETIFIEFEVKKKNREIFKIENYASLIFENNTIISNTVSTIGLVKTCNCKK